MKRLIVVPNISINEIEFGKSRTFVHDKLGKTKTFKKNIFCKNTSDDYGDFHIYYDENDCFEAIEIMGAVEIIIDGCIVYPCDTSVIINLISGFVKDGERWINIEKSIAIEECNGVINSILFGRKHYYAEDSGAF